MGNRSRTRKAMEADAAINLLPMMNLFSILIPYLLMCASFASIKLVELDLPETRMMVETQQQQKDKDDEGLLLTVFITDEGITLGARGAMLPTTYVKEVHKYVYAFPKDSKTKETFFNPVTKANKHIMPVCPKDPKRILSLFERDEIILYAVKKESETDTGTVVTACYDAQGQAVTANNGKILETLPNPGDTVYPLSLEDRRPHIVGPKERFKLQTLTVYDELASRLMRIKAQYAMVPDRDEIKLVAEDDVVYDKMIHIMDICRMFGYPKINLAKLAG